MNPLQTKAIPRDQLSQFLPTHRAITAFEGLQGDVTGVYSALSSAQFLTLAVDPNIGSERVFTPLTGDLVGSDGGANAAYTLSLSAVGTAGTVGAATKTISVTTDTKGRVTGVASYDLNTSNITEGTNLYFTTARARASISATTPLAYDNTTGVVSITLPGGTTNFLRADGAWAAPSGGGGGGGYSYTVTTRNVSYTETATTGDNIILVTGAAVTVTLPTAIGNVARITFKLTVAGTMTLSGSGGQTIDGGATAATSIQYTAITIISDGANWQVI